MSAAFEPETLDPPLPNRELDSAHSSLMLAVGALEMWQRRLRRLADHLPDPTVVSDEDPLSVPLAVRERVLGILEKRIAPAIAELREAARWMEDDL